MLESAWPASWVPMALFLVALLAVIAFAVKAVDLRRKRTGEAVHLRSAISDALLRERALSGLAITPTVSIGFWRGSPVTIAVSGTVPTPEGRETVIRVVRTGSVPGPFRLRPRRSSGHLTDGARRILNHFTTVTPSGKGLCACERRDKSECARSPRDKSSLSGGLAEIQQLIQPRSRFRKFHQCLTVAFSLGRGRISAGRG